MVDGGVRQDPERLPRVQRGVRLVHLPPVVRLGRTVGGNTNDDTPMLAIPGVKRQPVRSGSPAEGPGRRPGRRLLEPEFASHGAYISVDGCRDRDLADRDVGVFEAVAGKHAHPGGTRRDAHFQQPGD